MFIHDKKPSFLVIMYIRAENEGVCPLDLHVVSKMLPCFFAAEHHHYAQYATYYVNNMKNLSLKILAQFVQGRPTAQHINGCWNGYGRIIGFLATGLTILETVLKHELVLAAPSIFSKKGDILITTQRHVLYEKLQVVVSHRSLQKNSVSIVDKCVVLRIFQWPVNDAVEDIAENILKYAMNILCPKVVYLMFDRYKKYSIKESTQIQRSKNLAYRLALETA